jgi:hypothetical protein
MLADTLRAVFRPTLRSVHSVTSVWWCEAFYDALRTVQTLICTTFTTLTRDCA